jgi:hypothetical protein
MHNDEKQPHGGPAGGKQKPYATDDTNLLQLTKAGVVLTIFFAVNFALASLAYYLFVVKETQQTPPAMHAFDVMPRAVDPNVPILQKDPQAEMHKFRADEYDAEHSYSHWKDGDGKQSLRIPISRAMEIVKEHGLTRAVSSPAPAELSGRSTPNAKRQTPPTELLAPNQLASPVTSPDRDASGGQPASGAIVTPSNGPNAVRTP